MATSLLLRSLRRREVSTAYQSVFGSQFAGNAKSSWVSSHLSHECSNLAKLFSRKSAANDVNGIGLGSTSSCFSVMEGKAPRMTENAEGSWTTSMVGSNQKRELLVGTPAYCQAVTNPINIVFGTKHLIGRTYDFLTQKEMKMVFSTASGNQSQVVNEAVKHDQKMAPVDGGNKAGATGSGIGPVLQICKNVSSTVLPFWHIPEILTDYVHSEMTRTLMLIYWRLFLIIAVKDGFLYLF